MSTNCQQPIYEGELCLLCILSNQTSLGHMAHTLGSIGRNFCRMHEAGVELSDQELLREGIVAASTNDPEAAHWLDLFHSRTPGHQGVDGHQPC